jgi:hypothetical protein
MLGLICSNAAVAPPPASMLTGYVACLHVMWQERVLVKGQMLSNLNKAIFKVRVV